MIRCSGLRQRTSQEGGGYGATALLCWSLTSRNTSVDLAQFWMSTCRVTDSEEIVRHLQTVALLELGPPFQYAGMTAAVVWLAVHATLLSWRALMQQRGAQELWFCDTGDGGCSATNCECPSVKDTCVLNVAQLSCSAS